MVGTRRGRTHGTGAALPPGLELVAVRPIIVRPVDAWLPLAPGDRPLVTTGETVSPGMPLLERLRDAQLVEVSGNGEWRPGDRWSGVPRSGPVRRREAEAEGELLFESAGRWRIAAGEHHEPLDSPIAGIVREVRPGFGLSVRATGAGLRGAFMLGAAARGRLEIAAGADGELLPRSLDVGSAGAILVVGARIDAEALTRSRAMGVRGVVVAALGSKDRRDFLASEARQRAALHRIPPLGVLVLHGSIRRPIAAPLMSFLESIAGRDVAIVGEPPCLVFDPDGVETPVDPPESRRVHVRSGPLAGRSGTWEGPAGLRRFAGGTHLDAGFVSFGPGPAIAVPLADLERYV